MIRILLITSLFLLVGCSESTIEIPQGDILVVPDTILPNGIRKISTNRESEWRSRNAFFTNYRSENFILGLTTWFIHYPSENSAIHAYDRYKRGTFSYHIEDLLEDMGDPWVQPSESIDLDSNNYDEFDVRCRDSIERGGDTHRCAARIRYGQCIFTMSSRISTTNLTMSDFANVLNYVDTNMVNTDICYAS